MSYGVHNVDDAVLIIIVVRGSVTDIKSGWLLFEEFYSGVQPGCFYGQHAAHQSATQ